MGLSSGPDILFFKHFRSTWLKLHHQPQDTIPLVDAPTDVLQFLRTTMDAKHRREDYLELIHLAANMVGLPVVSSLRRVGALNRARWMEKATYALKIELLFRRNEEALHLTGRQLQGIRRRGVESCWFVDDGQTLLVPFSGIGFASAILNHLHDEVKVQLVAGI
ncbi:hypothetical protein LOD99_1437 [Oopsacas minuta]|uniref:Uncharacterized protein n=1 Tax=Oopsacas minuta TaxID=111878 RepID=A0AAV7K6M4_9METZ|nr:hypothetical protein LOD99_1437 [Oopsacas minuta]